MFYIYSTPFWSFQSAKSSPGRGFCGTPESLAGTGLELKESQRVRLFFFLNSLETALQ